MKRFKYIYWRRSPTTHNKSAKLTKRARYAFPFYRVATRRCSLHVHGFESGFAPPENYNPKKMAALFSFMRRAMLWSGDNTQNSTPHNDARIHCALRQRFLSLAWFAKRENSRIGIARIRELNALCVREKECSLCENSRTNNGRKSTF